MNLSEISIYYLRLYFTAGLGRKKQQELLRVFNSEEQFVSWMKNPNYSFIAHTSISEKIFDSIFSEISFNHANKEFELAQKNQIRILGYLSSDFPSLLKQTVDCPSLLFIRGNYSPLAIQNSFAIVGTRHATLYAKEQIEKSLCEISDLPLQIISGLALGVDTMAHETALKNTIMTHAVLAQGLSYIYPKENLKLAQKIVDEGGCLISEYAFATEAKPGTFVARNRIVSGLSKMTWVVEAPIKSGALITAEFALEQGREVLASPGNIFEKNSQGCHRLISEGADLFLGPQYLKQKVLSLYCLNNHSPMQSGPYRAKSSLADNPISSLGIEESNLSQSNQMSLLNLPALEPSQRNEILSLSEIETNIYHLLSFKPKQMEEVIEQSQYAAALVSQTLTELMLKGHIEELPGKNYTRI